MAPALAALFFLSYPPTDPLRHALLMCKMRRRADPREHLLQPTEGPHARRRVLLEPCQPPVQLRPGGRRRLIPAAAVPAAVARRRPCSQRRWRSPRQPGPRRHRALRSVRAVRRGATAALGPSRLARSGMVCGALRLFGVCGCRARGGGGDGGGGGVVVRVAIRVAVFVAVGVVAGRKLGCGEG